MRILHIIQKQQLRGAEVFASQMACQWKEAGHEVVMLALQPGQAVLPFKGRMEVVHADLSKRWVDIAGWRRIAALVRELKPDIVQANAADTLKYAVMSRLLFRWDAPIVYRNASMMSRYLKRGWQIKLNSFLLKNCQHIISVSEEARKDLLALSGLEPERVSMVPVGISVNREFPGDREPNGVRIVHVGGFSFEKNHKGLIRIFQQIKQRFPEAKLVLIGDGPLMGETRDLVRSQGLLEAIEFKGAVPDPLDHIRAADVLVLPSIIEGLPAVILEAFWCETPVVAYNVGGIGEVVKPSRTGWLVEKDDEAGFVRAVSEVIEMDHCDRKKILDNARELVVSNYDNKVLAKRFIDVFFKLTGKKGNE
jgi:glycosyltransferase involved in cell wall biosynthesis